MKNIVSLNGVNISYTLKSIKSTRNIRILVGGDGVVVVTKPFLVSKAFAHSFVRAKASWIAEHVYEAQKQPKKILAHYNAKDFKENKERARVLVRETIKRINRFYNFEVGKVAIRNQRTRWGSCSGKKNLNFNYKIIFLPEELQDYIVVHELCHLKEMNHSPRFWELVAKTVPDYKKRLKEINLY